MTSYAEKFEAETKKFEAETEEIKLKFYTDANNLINEYKNTFDELQESISSVIESGKNGDAILNSIRGILENANKIKTELEIVRSDIKNDKENGDLSILNDIIDSHRRITDVYNSIEELKKSIFGYKKKSTVVIQPNEYSVLKDDEKEIKNGKYYRIQYENILGIKDRLNETISNYQKLLVDDQEKIKERESNVNNKIADLYKKIEGLLPGATAAGLTAAYEKAKKETRSQIWIWTVSFALSLVGICAIIFFLFWKGLIVIDGSATFEQTSLQILRLLGFEFPFIWLAWTANIKVSQYSRLYEEYRHKWTMAHTFEGMQKALESSKNADEDNNTGFFYKALLENFALNPSNVLDKKYIPDGPAGLLAALRDRFAAQKNNES